MAACTVILKPTKKIGKETLQALIRLTFFFSCRILPVDLSKRLRAVKEVAWPDATPLKAPFVSPSAAGLRVPERPVDGELASGTSTAKRRRQTPAHGEVGGAGVEDGRRGAAAWTSTTGGGGAVGSNLHAGSGGGRAGGAGTGEVRLHHGGGGATKRRRRPWSR